MEVELVFLIHIIFCIAMKAIRTIKKNAIFGNYYWE